MHEQSLPPSDGTEPINSPTIIKPACPVCAKSGIVFETRRGWLKGFDFLKRPKFQSKLNGALCIGKDDLVTREAIIKRLWKNHLAVTVYCVMPHSHET